MGNGVIYWYPSDSDTLQSIDLGERWSDLRYECEYRVEGSGTASGGIITVVQQPRISVLAEWNLVQRSTNVDIFRKLRALECHYAKGGLLYIVDDSSKVMLSSSESDVDRGDSSISTTGNVFSQWDSYNLNTTDPVYLMSDAPESLGELAISASGSYTSTAPHQISFSSTLINTYRSKIAVRPEFFFPFLRRNPDSSSAMIFAERNRNFTVSLDCFIDLDAMFLACNAGHGAFKGTSVLEVPTADSYIKELD